MRNCTIFLLLLTCLALPGCVKKPELRLDDLSFGNKRTGLKSDNPIFEPGEEFYFNYAQRGAAPDSDGNAKVSLKATLSHSDKPIHQFSNETYKINSEITSYGPVKPEVHKIPTDATGPGVLTIVVTDHVIDKTITIERPYTVEPK
jgi:hypothetical protein